MAGPIVNRICRIVFTLLVLAYVLALGIFLIGTFGLLGQDRDPLSGVFLVPLGLPWNMLIDLTPERLWPWLAALAPALNLAILWRLCHRIVLTKR
jgi:hypothetical protein